MVRKLGLAPPRVAGPPLRSPPDPVTEAAGSRQRWQGRSHFLAAAAEAMRRILIDQVRRKAALKRGQARPLQELHETRLEVRAPDEEILAVHEALEALANQEPVAAQVVKLRYFVGLPILDIAEALEISPRTADRHWAFARAWLKRAIRGEAESVAS